MNEKEIGEIRRHLRRDRSNITAIYGCFVNDNKEIITEYRSGTGIMSENESDKYYSILRKVLSGSLGKNLIDLSFQTTQVVSGQEHKLLMDLRASKLEDDDLRKSFYQKIIDNIAIEGCYLILLVCDNYDVPFRSKDDSSFSDASDETYSYILCAVCPVKETKATLHYVPEEKVFHDGAMSRPVSAPEIGFLFPAFDNRATNIYNALYYTHNVKENQDSLLEAVFNVPVPKPADEQKKCFEALLTEALGDECRLDVVQAVHEELSERIALHKESKVPEPLLIDKNVVKDVLAGCGISETGLAKFNVQYDEVFGFETELHPKNIIDSKHFDIHTPDVAIRVDPTRSDIVETRVIDGVKYLLINADENIEVNGVNIHFDNKDSAAD